MRASGRQPEGPPGNPLVVEGQLQGAMALGIAAETLVGESGALPVPAVLASAIEEGAPHPLHCRWLSLPIPNWMSTNRDASWILDVAYHVRTRHRRREPSRERLA